MPEWAVDILRTLIGAVFGSGGAFVLAWRKFGLERDAQREQNETQQEQILRTVADTASTTALQCMEAATKELHIQLDETREELNAERTARLAELDVLRKRLAEAERKLVEVQDLLASATKKVQALEAERVHWEMERDGLLRRIGELEGKA